ncbi:chemotaxis-specific protein-glutamate methyltransferase CheB [Duganella sp. FT109W]|uniref:Protein-glutamate methylesterase/protein-glutamine glutaminase n=1 Tax=Duganella margarita TaxID=2692170 RepID=A0A7X4H7N4_9BURK|nr:chemotaxis-specific protein-glutamate methyltransferase CheB [Duganella margarita]MYM76084.1 chemotaxis-specific protein-glutamate methyltransferase CheB [Duganella margarita]MYN43306.1 chemotaxis-specific protein-glutamate methyltransferase CheB [Duganella margarita]
MKIAIANDVAMAAEALRRVVASTAEHQVLWIARTGAEAVRMAAESRPDLILMDLNMPELDGVEATRQIMEHSPCAILVVTGRPQDNVNQVFRALGAGALDVTATPVLQGQPGGDAELLAKIRTMDKLIRHSGGNQAMLPRSAANGGNGHADPDTEKVTALLAIGASTGGPVAVSKLLAGWKAPRGCAIVVVQHIDQHFADNFARWLGEQLEMPVRAAEEGDELVAGTILIAKSNDHLTLDQNLRLRYDAHPKDYAYRPSVDVFFHCVAQHWKGEAIGVLLTGMGRDGAEGLLAMRRAGQTTIAQDQASSAVYGMPRAAAELDAAQMILPLSKIGPVLRSTLGGRS